jgi:hypothetical protein
MGVAPPSQTQSGMGAASPSVTQAHDVAQAPTQQIDVATAPTEEMPAADPGTTSPGMGAAGPGTTQVHDVAQAPTQEIDIATAPTEELPAQDGGETSTPEAGVAGGPQQLEIISDPDAALAALEQAQANGEPYNWLPDQRFLRDAWVREAGQDPSAPIPPAWRGPNGLVVDGAVVPLGRGGPVGDPGPAGPAPGDAAGGGAAPADAAGGGGAAPAAAGPGTQATNATNASDAGGGPSYGKAPMSGPSHPAGQAALDEITEAFGTGGPAAAAEAAAQHGADALANAYSYLVAANQPGAALTPGAQLPTQPVIDSIFKAWRLKLFSD